MTYRFASFKRLVVGRPLRDDELVQQRLGKLVGLAVFSSDAVASTAFASQEILLVLVPVVGMAGFGYLTPISVLVMLLMVIVVASYRQSIVAYPDGGGTYGVSRYNLGERATRVAGAALLVDYVVNAAVSVAAGVAALTSAFSGLRNHQVLLSVGLIAFLAMANLRGAKESGRLFAPFVYGYVVAIVLLIVVGLARSWWGHLGRVATQTSAGPTVTVGTLTLLLLVRAFCAGAIALSGVEAVSNGVPAFRRPESRNASITLGWTAAILGSVFIGVALLAERLRPNVSNSETILSQMGRAVFGQPGHGVGGVGYLLLQAATVAILCLSANTSFADFPRLSAILAADGLMPRWLTHRGDRLVFSNGIIVLALLAAGLLIGFDGHVSRLVPLFAVALFTAFTVSQCGMAVHNARVRPTWWRWNVVLNIVGAAACAGVLTVVMVTTFTAGAWLPAVVIPLLVVAFGAERRRRTR